MKKKLILNNKNAPNFSLDKSLYTIAMAYKSISICVAAVKKNQSSALPYCLRLETIVTTSSSFISYNSPSGEEQMRGGIPVAQNRQRSLLLLQA